VAFHRERLALFIDGDFWHGYRFPTWKGELSEFWRIKIGGNRARDRRNFAALRRRGWGVVRLWQHDIKRDLKSAVDRVANRLLARRAETDRSGGIA
jgi:DNA mismatch endonuclease (patch repair protein)